MNKKTEIRFFFLVHFLSIILFAIVNYYLMIDINKHFLTNPNIPKHVYNNKILSSLYYSAGIESTNGSTDLIPSSIISKTVALVQYITTILITGYFLF
jgi:hypothetical protein